MEIFRFEVAVPGQKIFLEWGEQDPALRQLPVKLLDPWGKDLFGSLQVVAAQGRRGQGCCQAGGIRIVVGSEDAVVQGRYQLTVHAVDWPEVFDLPPAGILAPNLPAKGAGIIEAPGSVDTFLFTSEEQQQFILEFQHWEPGLLYVDWSIQNQLIGTLYSGNIGTYEKRIFTIQKPGDYRLEIGDGKDAGTGAYGLTFRAVPPPERFPISLDEVIELPMSDDGSGFIEAEAAADHYIWTQHEPGRVLIDLVDFDEALLSCQMGLYGPNSDEIFRPQSFFGNDPGSIFLETSGTYTLQVGGISIVAQVPIRCAFNLCHRMMNLTSKLARQLKQMRIRWAWEGSNFQGQGMFIALRASLGSACLFSCSAPFRSLGACPGPWKIPQEKSFLVSA